MGHLPPQELDFISFQYLSIENLVIAKLFFYWNKHNSRLQTTKMVDAVKSALGMNTIPDYDDLPPVEGMPKGW